MHLAFAFPGGIEWVVILVVALLIFGPRLPSVMRSLGRSVNEFKKGVNDVVDAAEAEEHQAETEKEKETEKQA